jgi:hypothetical protein
LRPLQVTVSSPQTLARKRAGVVKSAMESHVLVMIGSWRWQGPLCTLVLFDLNFLLPF